MTEKRKCVTICATVWVVFFAGVAAFAMVPIPAVSYVTSSAVFPPASTASAPLAALTTVAPPTTLATLANPTALAGNDGNTNPLLGEARSWTQLRAVVEAGEQGWYGSCLQERIGITWEQLDQLSELEEEGSDFRVIVVSNSDLTDAEARAALAAKDFRDLDTLKIIWVSGFWNTRGLKSHHWQVFWDNRSQVRLALGVPSDPSDLSKGFDQSRGVLTVCGNPWNVSPSSATTTSLGGATTTTSTSMTILLP
jgi:hypothetical protein